jgi:hypothetical protein
MNINMPVQHSHIERKMSRHRAYDFFEMRQRAAHLKSIAVGRANRYKEAAIKEKVPEQESSGAGTTPHYTSASPSNPERHPGDTN